MRNFGSLPMAYVRFVEIAQSIEGLFHDHGCLSFAQILLLCDVIEELPSLANPVIAVKKLVILLGH
jgi:hypothetical protein